MLRVRGHLWCVCNACCMQLHDELCLCRAMSMSGYVYVGLCLCQAMSMSGYVYVRLCLCRAMSMSGYVYVGICLCQAMSMSGYVARQEKLACSLRRDDLIRNTNTETSGCNFLKEWLFLRRLNLGFTFCVCVSVCMCVYVCAYIDWSGQLDVYNRIK